MAAATRSKTDDAELDKCWEKYQEWYTSDQGTLKVFGKISTIDNNENAFLNIPTKDALGYTGFCTIYKMQNDSYKQWQKDIKLLDQQLETMLSAKIDIHGGSQKGGADCPENFQKIFNYMFLIAASASIAVMSPDIELVTKVCMNALKLVFGTIAAPILNLLRVVFLFMLQSLVSIVKTAADVAIELISNFIKTVYLNIHTITSGAIGIAKVFIYKSLTYCKSFYNTVVAAMPKIADNTGLDLEDKPITPEKVSEINVSMNAANLGYQINPEDVNKINTSMNTSVQTELLKPDVIINITEERDIFMDMLNKVGNTIDEIRNKIKFGHTFLKTAYLLLCDNTHEIIKNKLGSTYNTILLKKSLTKALIFSENTVIQALNGVASFPENLKKVIIYNINVLCLKIVKLVYDTPVHTPAEISSSGKIKRTSGRKDRLSASEPYNVVDKLSETINSINDSELEFNLDFEKQILPKSENKVNNTISNIQKTVGNLTDNDEYVSIMKKLDKNLQEIIDRRDAPRFMNEGGSKKKTPKRKTKKAKKRGNKRRYSRKP